MCRCVGFFQIGLTWKFILFAMLLQTSKCGENLVLEIWIKMLHSIMSPWTMRENLMKPPEFFMVMSIFLKWMAGSSDRGRWQGRVIDSRLTFSFFQSFLLSTITKKQKIKKMRKSFSSKKASQLTCLHLYWPIYYSYFALGTGNSSLFYTLETWKASIVQIESIFQGQI